MAISPTGAPRFLQTTSRQKTEENLSNFQIRTGQKFGDIAKTKFLEQQLEPDLELAKRQSEINLRAREAEKDRVATAKLQRERLEAQRNERKREEKTSALAVAATIVGSFS